MILRCLSLLLLTASLFSAPAYARTAIDRRIRDAFMIAFPVYEMVRTRQSSLAAAERSKQGGINRFAHRRTLSDHTHRGVTTPNNDTLYSSAWLDLSGGPVIIDVPATGERYFSLALMDLFTDHFAYFGTRATGGRAVRAFVVGPTWRGRVPAGMRLVRAPTNDVWALGRTLVDGPSDLAAARAVQDGLVITPAPGSPPPEPFTVSAPLDPDAGTFLAVVNAALARSPLPPIHRSRLERLKPAGVGPDVRWSAVPPATRAAWEAGLETLRASLSDALAANSIKRAGWTYPKPGIGNFGTNDAYRAAVALEGLAALEPIEALYTFTREDAAGAPLDGGRRYRLRVPAVVPVDGFWSLSMYEVSGDGRLYFTQNGIGRFSIGNRTPGLVRNVDGSLDIIISREEPTTAKDRANWLPAPAGAFRMSFRAYRPRDAFRSLAFTLPPVQMVE
jgi:hypothetical protein